MSLPVVQPSRVTVMIKPVGALCNLDCTYCYYLPTKAIYDGREHRMSLRTLEDIYASVLPRFHDDVTIAWQGGEPMLAGLDFFKKAIEFQNKYKKPTQTIHHALQTNGTLLDVNWCNFLRKNDFLVGLSVDGPPRFHDHYRLSNRGSGSSDKVLAGLKLMQTHGVQHNILTVLNDFNVHYPDEIFHYLMNMGARWFQFIPAIEWVKDPADASHNVLAPFSPDPGAYGRFLCRVFDLWFEKYRRRVSIRIVDAVLNKLVLGEMPFCILDGSCHNQITIEHDGAVFGCDHFVERRWQYAQIGRPDWSNPINLDGSENVGLTVHGHGFHKLDVSRDIDSASDLASRYSADAAAARQRIDAPDPDWFDRTDTSRLGAFAARKQHLPDKCKTCRYKPFCHGGCPKHRPHGGDVPEPTILCEAYMAFYAHALPRLQWLAGYLRADQQPPDPQANARRPDPSMAHSRALAAAMAASAAVLPTPGALPAGPRSRAAAGRNDPCPCGSGLKYKKCHGRNL